MPLAVIIDDDPMIHQRFRRDFESSDIEIETADSALKGLDLVRGGRPDVVVLDVMLPDLSGLEAFQSIRQLDAHLPVIFITTSGESSTAIEAMTLGAYDYLLKPLDSKQLRELLSQAVKVRQLMKTPVELGTDGKTSLGSKAGDALIGLCPSMQAVYKDIGRVAPQDVTVLIQGESGTGKELVARAVYQHSRRRERPFLAINCAAIPENLLESELFGHEKGSFSGADRRRIGKFEQCSGGTLFLDEIGDMTPATQSKILRLLQQQKFERVGGNEVIQADVRVVAATNVDLEKAVASGEFRKDLFYRLNVFTIKLPSLRERKEDLPLLVEHFLLRFADELERHVTDITPEALQMLIDYEWPGNIRELESVLKQAILQAKGSVLLPEFIPDFIHSRIDTQHNVLDESFTETTWTQFFHDRIQAGSENLRAEAVERLERHLIVDVLRHTGGNQLQAAKILGITRGNLRNKVRALEITIDRVIDSTSEADTES